MIPEDINEKREDIIRIARRQGVLTVRLFGSHARGDTQATSWLS
jgi:predicted nucleotidyltransferase